MSGYTWLDELLTRSEQAGCVRASLDTGFATRCWYASDTGREHHWQTSAHLCFSLQNTKQAQVRNTTHCASGNTTSWNTMCPHKYRAVHFALTSICKYGKNSYKNRKDVNKYSQSGPWWWREQSVQNSTESNSGKYDKSFNHHILEYIPLHLHWMTKLVPRANYATFYWSPKLPTFHTPLNKYCKSKLARNINSYCLMLFLYW